MSLERRLGNIENGLAKISNNLLASCMVLNLVIPAQFTGALAKSEIENYITPTPEEGDPVVPVFLTTEETANIADMLAWINGAANAANKLMRKEAFWALLDNIETGTQFNTEAKVRAGILAITAGAVTWSEEPA